MNLATRTIIIATLGAGLLWAGATLAGASSGDVASAPGYGPLEYVPPVPGTYALPALGPAPDGHIVDANDKDTTLHSLLSGKISLIAFMYSNCGDVNGCPLASFVFYRIKAAMQKDPVLARRLRLISLSFDPERDTPEIMRLYAANFAYAGTLGEWAFVTTRSEAQLQPILRAYRQDLQKTLGQSPQPTQDFSHLLRVFLVDEWKRIRNIYSVAFLHADLLLNDVHTLLLEAGDTSNATPSAQSTVGSSLSRPGDDKSGYEDREYETRSLALIARTGKKTDLLAVARKPPLGLPPVPVPASNPLTKKRVALGRKLFFDRRLSINGTFSCAMCHVPEQGFTSNEMATAVGVEGRSVRRNSPTIYNVAYATRLFHDGREENLEQQVWGPLLAKNEMANPSVGYVLGIIRSLPDYEGLFEAAFDGKPVGMETLGQALAGYERVLVSGGSTFDRWRYGRESGSLPTPAQRGFDLFTGKAGCSACHLIGEHSALFTDNKMHNTGIGYARSMGKPTGKKRVVLAPGVFVDVDREVINAVGESPPQDIGLYEITENPVDRWKYKTPTLRNVELTAPYMHNGGFSTLREVVEFYNRGGVANESLDPLIRPLQLTPDEVSNLVSFLRSLTGNNVDTLVADAFAAPVGDHRQAGKTASGE